MAEIIYWNQRCQLLTNKKVWELVFDDAWFNFRTYPYLEILWKIDYLKCGKLNQLYPII